MTRSEVALLGCDSYSRVLVEEKVGAAFELLRGARALVGEGGTVFVKVNALVPKPPDAAVTTHPEVVRAVVRELQGVAREVVIGDSPGGIFTEAWLRRVYQKCGFARVAEETGASLNYDTSVAAKDVPDGKRAKSVSVMGALEKADRVVSVSKFKTHLQMCITCAIKNTFGVVPGITKATYHARCAGDREFAEMVVDVMLAADADLHIVDAVVGMDGNGPQRGDRKKMSLIAAGRDACAVDAAVMDLAGIDRRRNVPLAAAIDRGLLPGSVTVLSDGAGPPAIEGFALPTKKDITARLPGFVMDRFGRYVSILPGPDPSKCTGCGRCAEMCGPGAIKMLDGVAVVDYRKCIKCYCCYELCEFEAVELERPLLLRLAGRIGM